MKWKGEMVWSYCPLKELILKRNNTLPKGWKIFMKLLNYTNKVRNDYWISLTWYAKKIIFVIKSKLKTRIINYNTGKKETREFSQCLRISEL